MVDIVQLSLQLLRPYFERFGTSNEIKDAINERIISESKKEKESLRGRNPFLENETQLERFRKSLSSEGVSDQGLLPIGLGGYRDLHRIADIPFYDEGYWENALVNLRRKAQEKDTYYIDETELTSFFLSQKWEQDLKRYSEEWEDEQMLVFARNLGKRLLEWMPLIAQLYSICEKLGFGSKLLFNLTKGEIVRSNIETLRKWFEILENNESLLRLADMLGRIHSAIEGSNGTTTKVVEECQDIVPDCNSREEVTGLKLGNSLNNLVPQELQLLENEDTELLFYKKFAESQLMCFDIHGYANETLVKESATISTQGETTGPIIICVDTSGSMQGVPETVAKAMTVALACRAKEQGRDCYLINYSTEITTLDFSRELGIHELIGFLEMSFHGGTDLAPALRHTLIKIKEDKLRNADVLIVSDFIMDTLPKSVLNDIKNLKDVNGNRFHALIIGQKALTWNKWSFFDSIWEYDLDSGDFLSQLGTDLSTFLSL